MGYDKHPAVDLVRQKILFLIDEWISRGYSPERIGEMCGLSKVHIYALLKQPDHPGYKGSNLTLNTALKIWTGLGNPIETLLSDCDADYTAAPQGFQINQILAMNKQVLEFDVKIMETVLKRRAITPNKMKQLESILSSIQEILANMKTLAMMDEKKQTSSTEQPPPAAAPRKKQAKKRP